MITTTLNAIRAHKPCEYGWKKLLAHLGKTKADDEPLPLVAVLDSNGFADALWCLCTRPDLSNLWRLYAVWCELQTQLLLAKRHAHDSATNAKLDAARVAARVAEWDKSRGEQVEKLRQILTTGEMT